MKKILVLISASVMILFTAACNKEQEKILGQQDNDLVYITASFDPETKSTLNDVTGAFAFSYGDAIKVSNGSGTFSGTTTSTENSGTFAMEVGFDGSKSGIAGFPASLVTAMTSSSVTFTLPASYEYSEVGGTNPSASKVPCPMIGDYNGTTQKVTLKQAGSVIRFQVTNIAAGSITFTFETKVSGMVTLSGVPESTTDGILAGNLSAYGYTITINDVPEVTPGNYIYITIPVPTSTSPQNILVTNTPGDASSTRMQAVTGSSTPLIRAGGYKLSVAPSVVDSYAFTINADKDKVVLAPGNLMAKISETYNAGDEYAIASEWKFGDYNETLGNAPTSGNYYFAFGNEACRNMWVDHFIFQGASVVPEKQYRGLVRLINNNSATAYNTDWVGNVANESLYEKCWNTDVNNPETPTNGGIHIENGGNYTWRSLTYEEWLYIFAGRSTSKLNNVENARHARATVAGVNGILIFPDNIGFTWNEGTMGSLPSDINQDKATQGSSVPFTYGSTNIYTASNFLSMANVGVVFLPCAGMTAKDFVGDDTQFNTFGYYWTSTGTGIDASYGGLARYVNFNETETAPVGAWTRRLARSVRLARDI